MQAVFKNSTDTQNSDQAESEFIGKFSINKSESTECQQIPSNFETLDATWGEQTRHQTRLPPPTP
jgi:hypothetical protein